jgi:hypothetical protein
MNIGGALTVLNSYATLDDHSIFPPSRQQDVVSSGDEVAGICGEI